MKIIGWILLLVSLFAISFLILALIDPVAAKGSDDNDPFGTPPSRLLTTAEIALFLGLAAAGVLLVRRPKERG